MKFVKSILLTSALLAVGGLNAFAQSGGWQPRPVASDATPRPQLDMAVQLDVQQQVPR